MMVRQTVRLGGAARRARWGIAVLATITACNWGLTPAKYARTMEASGSPVTVALLAGAPVRGELLAVDTAGVIVRGERLVRVQWPAVRQVEVHRPARLRLGGQAARARSAELALYSRFPQGLSPALLARVLTAVGQDSLDVAR